MYSTKPRKKKAYKKAEDFSEVNSFNNKKKQSFDVIKTLEKAWGQRSRFSPARGKKKKNKTVKNLEPSAPPCRVRRFLGSNSSTNPVSDLSNDVRILSSEKDGRRDPLIYLESRFFKSLITHLVDSKLMSHAVPT